jgi:hypothetical protein
MPLMCTPSEVMPNSGAADPSDAKSGGAQRHDAGRVLNYADADVIEELHGASRLPGGPP